MKPRETMRKQNHAKPSKTTRNEAKQLATMRNYMQPCATTQNHVEQCQTMQNLVKPLITTIGNIYNHFKPDLNKRQKCSGKEEEERR